MSTRSLLAELCRNNGGGRTRLAVAGAASVEVLASLRSPLADGLAEPLLIGDGEAIRSAADQAELSLEHTRIIQADDGPDACAIAAGLAYGGEAGALMKGLVQTSDFVRAVLSRDHRLVGEGALLSHAAMFEVPGFERTLIVTDAAINTADDVETKLQILINAVRFAHTVGLMRPQVALIAAAERVSDKVPSTGVAAELAAIAPDRVPDLAFDVAGPFGLDVALSKRAAETKGLSGSVPGHADILLMPNLDAGNVLYKALTHLVGSRVAAIVLGATVPIVLTSRADEEETKDRSIRLALRVARVGG